MLQGSVALFCYGAMKGFRKNLSWIWNTLCGVSSVVSLGLLIFGNEHAVIIALSVFILCLVSLSIVLIRAVNSYFNATSDTDHNRIYTDIRYETNDGYNINYNIYRIIQSKVPLLQQINHGFKWSGTKSPKISSDLQELSFIQNGAMEDDFDIACLKFDRPLKYNETAVVHFKAELDDSDEKSDTMISYKVSSYSELIHFRVILRHKGVDYKSKAKVYKRRIGASVNKLKEIDTIPFDHQTKSFEYLKERPEIGYLYILKWDR